MLPDNFDREGFISGLREKHAHILLPSVAMSVDNGWLRLIAAILGEIETCLESHGCLGLARVVRIKEKLAAMRVYVEPISAAVHLPKQLEIELTDIRDKAEQQSMQTCEVCGDPAKVGNYDGCYQTLCRYHRHERLAWLAAGGPGLPSGFAAAHADEIEQAISEYLRTGDLPEQWTARFDHLTGIRHRQAISCAKMSISQIAAERARGDQND
ncbi:MULTISPECIES: hypothetical protein [unclassified Ensifer]|uniref:hypothetical protein n=1 Tax=unclassified Ensifer TaxID=2633371 RepID=UPI000812E2A1|nr:MULTISPECIES: hypothetical protein [unclassified Ensifer]OCP33340.1 hypothetical protein BC364_16905 [Ensifer sp. LC499]